MELRSVATTTKSAIAVSAALPLAFALSSSNPNPKSKTLSFHSISNSSLSSSFHLVKNLIQPPSAAKLEMTEPLRVKDSKLSTINIEGKITHKQRRIYGHHLRH
ncbi:uncharacterized protein LOC130015317 [Mercurialis annua]|uniref:uncharacterized protein LOC130015317 n=1 Tax=Mercurialis annua TaxID=3986 RepID=UPI0024AD3C28|nr:uncharacterized protein LOC130015317 [Mercurialis annua]